MRPMLERIDVTVRHLTSQSGNATMVPSSTMIDYTLGDLWTDFQTNPGGVMKVGGSALVDDYPQDIRPQGKFSLPAKDAQGKIALIGHSAGGWIARVYLSNRNYGGRSYNGQRLVHSLITLGSPHGNAPGPAFAGVEWINREAIPTTVRALAVAGKGYPGDTSGDLTQNAYSFCCADGSDGRGYDGDGVTPVESALAMEGAEELVLQGRVTHFPWSNVLGGDFFAPDLAKDHRDNRTPWYGDDVALDQWLGWLEQATY